MDVKAKRIKKRLEGLNSVDLDTLLRTGRDLGFEEVKREVQSLLEDINFAFSSDYLVDLPQKRRDRVLQEIENALTPLEALKTFNLKNLDAPQRRQNIINQIQSSFDSAYGSFLSDLRSYKTSRLTDTATIEQRFSEAEKTIQEIEALRDKINQLEAAREEVQGVTVDKSLAAFAETYRGQAEDYGDESKKWRLGTLGAYVATVFFAMILLFLKLSALTGAPFIDRGVESSAVWQATFLVIKIGLVLVLFQVARFCQKNYNALKHLQYVANHRKNVLTSLGAFWSSTEDPEYKDKILVLGAKLAYELGESGYISTKEGAGSGEEESAVLLNLLSRR